jgi:hypothetical protein
MLRTLGAFILLLVECAAAPQVFAQAMPEDCPVISESPEQLVLQCGADAAPLVLNLPDLAAAGYDGTLFQGQYTTTLVWLTQFGGVTHSPVWRYLTSDGSFVCQLDGRPSVSGNIARTCVSLDTIGL